MNILDTTAKKRIRNQAYYEKHKESHLQKMNNYYNDKTKHDKFVCWCCGTSVLCCAKSKHELCKKHIRNLEKLLSLIDGVCKPVQLIEPE